MYSTILGVHIITLICTLSVIVYVDSYALRWIRGNETTLGARKLRNLHSAVALGLTLMILSGGYMASTQLAYLLREPAFLVKMFFVLALVINAAVIHHFMGYAIRARFVDLPRTTRRVLYGSGLISTTSWLGALVAALIQF